MWDNMTTYMNGHGWEHMLLGGFMMTLFWGAVIALLFFLMRDPPRSREKESEAAYRRQDTALDLLRERYARGEIDQAEYEQRKRDLAP